MVDVLHFLVKSCASIFRSAAPPVDMRNLSRDMEDLTTVDEEFSERDGARSMMSDSLASSLPSDAALLASISDRPQKTLPGSRCPFPHN